MARQAKNPISKKRKFVKDGIFYAELNDFLSKELGECGYAGCEVRVTPKVTEVIIRATKTMGVVGEKGQKIRELTALITKRFNFKTGSLQLVAEKVKNRGLSSLAQAEAVRYRLMEGLSVRRACYSVLKFIKERGAKGVFFLKKSIKKNRIKKFVYVSNVFFRGQRAKSMKFREGYMLHAGDAVNYYIDEAVKHLHLKQGVLGIKVKIMLPYDPSGKTGVPRELPDVVVVRDPKEEPTGQSVCFDKDRADQAAILQDVVNESLRKEYPRDQQADSGADSRYGQSERRGGFGGGYPSYATPSNGDFLNFFAFRHRTMQ
ncbi:ribosomal protein S3 [Reticulomyxa filosa]|uniref:40S ribosomal protein S3 n=1 Tax=Reticulomyxa filosa TaxID=46433 RepID=X6NHW1_RETFI|nr:ribosomal protein S3 [Reticulomyxa filosa]|eukprot:ETO25885.1 ribosomal protein S3 [Reticulomyxa filosa]